MDSVYRHALVSLRGMWHQRWIGLAAAWLVGVLALIVVLFIPERYEASARIFANTDTILKPLMKDLTVQPNEEQRILMLSRVVVSRPNIEKIVQQGRLDADTQSKDEYDRIVDRVMRSLQIRGTGRDNVYTVSYRDQDPGRARRVVDLFANLFIETSRGGKEQDTESARRFIDEQIVVYEKKLQEAEDRLKTFKLRYLGLTPGEGKDHFMRMAETQAALSAARLELREAEHARDAYRRRLDAMDVPETGGATVNVEAIAALAEIDARIDSMRRNLDGLLQKYTDQHPDVIGVKRVIRDLEEQRRRIAPGARGAASAAQAPVGPGGVRAAETLKVQLAQAEAQVASLRTRVDEYAVRYERLKESAARVPQIEAEFAQLNRDYDINKKNFETLVARRESASISSEMQSAAGTDFRVIDPPRVSPRPVFPNRQLLMLGALLAAIVAGGVAAFVAMETHPTFFDSKALRESTGLPVLGVVSLVPSPAQRQEARRSALRFAGGAGGLVATYALGFLVVAILRDRLG